MRSALAVLILAACGPTTADPVDARAPEDSAIGTDTAMPVARWQSGPTLPTALGNNAVAAVEVGGACRIYSFLGIGEAREHDAISDAAFRWDEGAAMFRSIGAAPGSPRLAASAVTLRGRIYLIGGYTVAPGGAEASVDRVDVLDPSDDSWSSAAPVPIPIDDAVVLAWRDRWIVVVSGWSNTGNRAETQLYDADTDAWSVATPFPGTPAFGHTGAIHEDTLVVIDGVRDSPFTMIEQSWRGTLDPARPTEIVWTALPTHPGPTRYRAAGGATQDGRLIFAGGTDQPYNFDGLTYAGSRPAPPLSTTLIFDPRRDQFSLESPSHPSPTMDHRGLVRCGARLFTVGGMVAGPQVTAASFFFTP